jgi:hypothetical protein
MSACDNVGCFLRGELQRLQRVVPSQTIGDGPRAQKTGRKLGTVYEESCGTVISGEIRTWCIDGRGNHSTKRYDRAVGQCPRHDHRIIGAWVTDRGPVDCRPPVSGKFGNPLH